jgi:diacylglycerol kinase family enzyme
MDPMSEDQSPHAEPLVEHQMEGHAGAAFAGPVVLVVSPHAGKGEGPGHAERAGGALRAAGVEIGQQLAVGELDQHQAQGPLWRARGMRAAVAAGGDGTIGAVASQLAGSGLPLGILPLGTSNDTARSLGVPLDLVVAAGAIAAGQPMAIDAGQALPALTAPGAFSATAASPPAPATATDAGTTAENRPSDDVTNDVPNAALGAYFLHALTLGLNVQFARLATDVARRQRFGPLTYATSALQALATYHPVAVTLRFSGLKTDEGEARDEVITARVVEVAVVNTPAFGGAMNMRLPDVGMRDALLDFLVLEALDPARMRQMVEALLAALGRLPETARGGAHGRTALGHDMARADQELGLALPGIKRYKARSALIETERSLDVTLDGEVCMHTPVLVRVVPDLVRVFLPPEARAALH